MVKDKAKTGEKTQRQKRRKQNRKRRTAAAQLKDEWSDSEPEDAQPELKKIKKGEKKAKGTSGLKESEVGDVRHEPAEQRFVLPIGGMKKVGVLEYAVEGEEVDMWHTEVPVGARGRGLGALLAQAALDWAAGEGRRVRLSCTFLQR